MRIAAALTCGAMRTITTILLVLLAPGVARAETAACTSSRRLDAGTPAPCSGVLVPVDRLHAATRCVVVDLPACRVDLAHAATTCQADLDALHGRLSSAAQLVAQRGAELDACLAQPRVVVRPPDPQWYQSGLVWGVVGAAVGLAAGVLAGVKVMR